jgi:hypothetical protein
MSEQEDNLERLRERIANEIQSLWKATDLLTDSDTWRIRSIVPEDADQKRITQICLALAKLTHEVEQLIVTYPELHPSHLSPEARQAAEKARNILMRSSDSTMSSENKDTYRDQVKEKINQIAPEVRRKLATMYNLEFEEREDEGQPYSLNDHLWLIKRALDMGMSPKMQAKSLGVSLPYILCLLDEVQKWSIEGKPPRFGS